jgi:hypothetical protein
MMNNAGSLFHGDHVHGAHGSEISQATVGHGANASRSTAKKAANGRFNYGRGIAAKFPSRFAGFPFEYAQAHTRLANRNSIAIDRFNLIHTGKVEEHSPMERHGLAVVPCPGASRGHGNFVGVAVGQHILNFPDGQWMNDNVRDLAVELLA